MTPEEPMVCMLDGGVVEAVCVLPGCTSAGSIDIDVLNGMRIEIEVDDGYR